MAQLIRIIYISRSTFKPVKAGSSIEPNVARILAKSRINNKRNGLVGVLYFGDGCFFQCLEGEKSAIEALYLKLLADVRHKDMKLVSREPIAVLTYMDWAMKYVPSDIDMTRLLKVAGLESFDPYRFDNATVHKVLNLLSNANTDTKTTQEVEQLIKQSTLTTPANSTPIAVWLLGAVGVLVAVAVAAGMIFLRK